MVEIGGRPILRHIMSIFSTHGVNEFIIAIGYKAEMIKEYFLDFHVVNNDITATCHRELIISRVMRRRGRESW